MPVTPSNTERAPEEGLRVFCLGSFRVYRGSEEIREDDWGRGRGPTQKIKAMFAYLLSQEKRGVRRETLTDFLWPEQIDYDRAGASFHLALYCLRRALEPDLKSGADSSYIRYTRGRYRFDPAEPYWIDVDVFENYCRRAQDCDRGGDPEAAMVYWGMALDVYGGDYMAGIDVAYTHNRIYDWCMPRRHRLRELYLTALLEMARYYRNTEEYGSCVRFARQAMEVEPALEPAHRIAMQCLVGGGQLESAIRQYRMCETELAQHENRTPSMQTRLLYEQLIENSTHK
ncbi:MAG: BTAD domain-containing putative transcriptional regulator [Anaerolineae bacterium]